MKNKELEKKINNIYNKIVEEKIEYLKNKYDISIAIFNLYNSVEVYVNSKKIEFNSYEDLFNNINQIEMSIKADLYDKEREVKKDE